VISLAGEPGGAASQGYYVCPICAGRFDRKQLVPELHKKNAPPRRFQRLALCCPHCKTALRSRYAWRHAFTALLGLWLLLIVVRMLTRLPADTKDSIQLALLGIWALYELFSIVATETSPRAFVRDTRLDPPAA
jgi:hypothetical protein